MDSDLFRAIRRGAGGVQAIRRIVAKNPQVLLETSRDGRSPLHEALDCGARLDVVRCLVEQRPQALQETDRWGHLPAHHATRCNASLAALRCVVEPYPQALRHQSVRGFTPLHYAAQMGKNLEKVRYLVSTCPAAVRCRTKGNGRLPLHLACERVKCPGQVRRWRGDLFIVNMILLLAEQWPESLLEEDHGGCTPWEVCLDGAKTLPSRGGASILYTRLVEDLLKLCPRAIRTWVSDSLLPLQLAVRENGPQWLLGCLLDTWPESILALSRMGESILHVAALSHSETTDTLGTVRFLVERDSRIVAARSGDGSLPLHAHAGVHCPRPDVIRFLADRHPPALHESDGEGRTPLHCAVATRYLPPFLTQRIELPDVIAGFSREVVRFLVEQRPKSLHEQDRRGDLPLHIAVQDKYLRLELVDYLATSGPRAVAETNRRGWSPLHLVAQSEDLSLQAVQVLVSRCPGALGVGDGARRRLPLHLVCARGDTYLDVARYLVEQRPDAARHRDVDGWLPLHCAASAFDGRSSSLEVSRLLLADHPDAASVATLDEGCMPIHLVLARRDDEWESDGESIREGSNELLQVLPLVKLLVEACPECLLATNKDGLLPVLVAAANPAVSLDLVFRVLTEYPDSIPSPVGRPSKRPRLR